MQIRRNYIYFINKDKRLSHAQEKNMEIDHSIEDLLIQRPSFITSVEATYTSVSTRWSTISPSSRFLKMRMIGELNLFLGIQVKHLKDRIFISQSKYIKDLLGL